MNDLIRMDHPTSGFKREVIEEKRNAVFVARTQYLDVEYGWTANPVDLFWSAAPDLEQGHDFYFIAFLSETKGPCIGKCPDWRHLEINGIITQDNHFLYSSYRHDLRKRGDCWVDGGRTYMRSGASHKAVATIKLHTTGPEMRYQYPHEGRVNVKWSV